MNKLLISIFLLLTITSCSVNENDEIQYPNENLFLTWESEDPTNFQGGESRPIIRVNKEFIYTTVVVEYYSPTVYRCFEETITHELVGNDGNRFIYKNSKTNTNHWFTFSNIVQENESGGLLYLVDIGTDYLYPGKYFVYPNIDESDSDYIGVFSPLCN